MVGMGIIRPEQGQCRARIGSRDAAKKWTYMEPFEVIEVETPTVACDGGNGPLGHPRVFLTLSKEGEIECPYCSRKYVLKHGAKAAAGH
jgi:uncharacterized Zn-finger protein